MLIIDLFDSFVGLSLVLNIFLLLVFAADVILLAVGAGIRVIEAIVVLSPLIVVSLEPSGILLIIVLIGVDEVI